MVGLIGLGILAGLIVLAFIGNRALKKTAQRVDDADDILDTINKKERREKVLNYAEKYGNEKQRERAIKLKEADEKRRIILEEKAKQAEIERQKKEAVIKEVNTQPQNISKEESNEM